VFVMGARVPAASPGDRSAGLRVLRAAAMVGIAAGLASLPLRAASVSDAGFPAAWDLETLRFVLTGRFGDAALVRIAGLALLAGFLPVLPIGPASRRPEPDGPGGAGPYGSANGHRLTGRRPRGRRVRGRGARAARAYVGGVADRLVLERIACLVGGLIVLLSYAIVGHPQSSAPSFVLIPAQCIHVAVVSTWFGGVTFLALELRHQRRDGTARGFGEVVARFSTVASVTVALAGATGATMAWSQLHTLDALTSTAYGRALLAKLTVLAVPLALGFYNRQRLVPAIVGRDEAAAWRQIRLTLTLEALFIALGVLLATAAMTSGGFP
jgi:putative copper export protein